MGNIKKGPNEKTCEAFIKELKELLAKYDATFFVWHDVNKGCGIGISSRSTNGRMIISASSSGIDSESNIKIDPNLEIDWKKEYIPAKRDLVGNIFRDENGKVIFPGKIVKYTGTVSDIDRTYSEIVFEIFPTNHEAKGVYASSYKSWSVTCFGKQICDIQDELIEVRNICLHYLEENWEEISKKLTVKTERK